MLEDGLAIDDRSVRSKLANWAVRASGLKYTSMRAISALSKGERPGPENSIGKLVAGSMIQDVAAYALDLQGAAGVLSGPEDAEAAGKFQAMLLRAPGTRVEGGTDEIMRNIIAERVLGLARRYPGRQGRAVQQDTDQGTGDSNHRHSGSARSARSLGGWPEVSWIETVAGAPRACG